MPATIILGDVHIAKGLSMGKTALGTAINSRLNDQLVLLDWVLDQCEIHNVENLIITGDVFEDPKPHPMYITLFFKWLKKCESHGITVHIIAGNHDLLRSSQFYISALDIFSEAESDFIKIYKDITTIHTDGVSYTLLPFRDRKSLNCNTHDEAISILKDQLPFEHASIDPANIKIVVGHLAIEGSIPIGDEIDDMSNELFCPISMFKDYNYTWMGHIHKPQVMSFSPYVAHVGSMDLSDFSEANQKKIIILFDHESSEPVKHIEVPSRPLRKISISVPEKTIDTTKYVEEQLDLQLTLDRAIVKLEITLNSPELLSIDRKIIEEKIYSKGIFHLASLSESKKISFKKKDADVVDSTMTESAAIKMYAKAFIEIDQQNDFIALADSIVKDFQSELKD